MDYKTMYEIVDTESNVVAHETDNIYDAYRVVKMYNEELGGGFKIVETPVIDVFNCKRFF